MQNDSGAKPARLPDSQLKKLFRWAFIIGLWLLYILFVVLFIRDETHFPVTIFIIILVMITGSQFGIRVGLMAGLFGLPITFFSYYFLYAVENINPIRMGLLMIGYFLVGGIAGQLHDLHEQLNKELEHKNQEIVLRKRIEGALRESEKNYRVLFELEADAIFIIQNQDGAILEVNDLACNMYGYSREELLRLKNTDMSAEPEETKAATQRTVPIDQVVKIPLRFHRKKDGTVFPVEITARFIHWKGRSVHIAAIRDITDRRKAEQELERLATTDPLTGLLNRRQFFKEADVIFTRAQHHPYELAVFLLDIDHFKDVNDNYGHATGDAALREVAKRLHDNVRPTDVVGRYGGEEFTILLPRTNITEACQIAGRLCIVFAEKPITVYGEDIYLTVSIGVAGLNEDISTLDELLQHADQALYASKEAGRNRWSEWRTK